MKLTPSFALAFPHNDSTIGDLVRDIAALNHAHLVAEGGGWNGNDVWETVCRVIVRQTGVERELITPEASIVDHLGIC